MVDTSVQFSHPTCTVHIIGSFKNGLKRVIRRRRYVHLKGEMVRYRNLSDPSSDCAVGKSDAQSCFSFHRPHVVRCPSFDPRQNGRMAHFSHKGERQFKIGGELEVGKVSKRNT
jgi:hypothetical protein